MVGEPALHRGLRQPPGGYILSGRGCILDDAVEAALPEPHPDQGDRETGRPSIALCEQICTIPKASPGDYIGVLPPEEMAALEVGLIASLGMGARFDFAEPVEPAEGREPSPAEQEARAEIARLNARLEQSERFIDQLLNRLGGAR